MLLVICVSFQVLVQDLAIFSAALNETLSMLSLKAREVCTGIDSRTSGMVKRYTMMSMIKPLLYFSSVWYVIHCYSVLYC